MVNKRILIIDDDPNIRELISVNLRARGYDVDSACDGKEAIDIIMEAKPDLIVLDIMMPEIDGWEVCKMVKDDPDLQNTKVLMLTAKDTDKDKMIGTLILKADEYMTKPFDVEELVVTIQKILYE